MYQLIRFNIIMTELIRSLNLPGAFDHIFWIKCLKLHVYFLSRIAFFGLFGKMTYISYTFCYLIFLFLRNYFKVYWATLINVYIYIWTYSLLTNLMKTCVLCEGLNFVVIFQTLKSDPLLYKERKLYVYFFTNPACLRQLFDEMSSRLQAQKM